MPQNSKELVRSLFAGKPVSRPPFIPLVASVAAQFMQVPISQMYSNPTAMANCLQSCQRLFKYDGIVVLYDTTLEAEALGCQVSWPDAQMPEVTASVINNENDIDNLNISNITERGRIPAVLEAAQRLTKMAGKDVAMIGAITGPVTLSNHLMTGVHNEKTVAGNEIFDKLISISTKIGIILAKAFGEMNFDAILLVDDELAALASNQYSKVKQELKTLHNVLNFYNTPLIIKTGRVAEEDLEEFFKIEAEGFALKGSITDRSQPAGTVVGRYIPIVEFATTSSTMEKSLSILLNGWGKQGYFITSEGEVPLQTSASNMRRMMDVLKEYYHK